MSPSSLELLAMRGKLGYGSGTDELPCRATPRVDPLQAEKEYRSIPEIEARGEVAVSTGDGRW
jgi:hypothetical protein